MIRQRASDKLSKDDLTALKSTHSKVEEADMPHLAHVLIYPIKSLDGISVSSATVLASGALKHDREFAIVDAQGRFVNGKHNAQVHLLRSHFSLSHRTVTLQIQGTPTQQIFHLDDQRDALEAWLSDFFGFSVQLQQNLNTGFPDDTESPGPTVISTATLIEVASWFPGISLDEMRRRIRANIEIDDVPAFWEDQLFSATGDTVSFQIGNVEFKGINPCQRCVVPTRDSLTATPYPYFQKTFITKRKETLHSWVAASRFNHFFRLSVNTRISKTQKDKSIHLGDTVEVYSRQNS
jgi:uncharacterized protein YcbX